MKRAFLLLFLLVPFYLSGQVKITEPGVKTPTTFAIIIDQATYDNTREAVELYRSAVEADGLGTYIVSAPWTTPEEVRDELVKLNGRKPPLEGVVFIGDIPVAMIRQGQHMTTAFKMNEEKFPMVESSVPSDRYYDDLRLTFDFVKRDSLNPHLFYYNLRGDCPQRLNPTFYSARIKHPEGREGNKYEEIAKFLRKAAHEKRQCNALDTFVTFNGSGYNSDCLVSWMDLKGTLQESFPKAFGDVNSCKILNFRMENPAKYMVLDELQRPDVDVMLINEHGSPDILHIDDGIEPDYSDYKYVAAAVGRNIRDQLGYARWFYSEEDVESFKEYYAKELNVSREWLDELLSEESAAKDKEYDAMVRASSQISLAELTGIKTYPRFVMFNACYNADFSQDNVASYFIFNEGATVITQGNTRNVLQDKWSFEMMGLLSHGVRVGHWQNRIVTLESHLVGDPTFHFAPIAGNNLNYDIVMNRDNAKVWRKYLKSPYADVQSLALYMLAASDSKNEHSGLVYDYFLNSQFGTVRMQALRMLSEYNDGNFAKAIIKGLYDPYETVRKHSVYYAEKSGDPQFIPFMADIYVNNHESKRVHYAVGNALEHMEPEQVKAALEKSIANSTGLRKDTLMAETKKKFDNAFDSAREDLATMRNEEAAMEDRARSIKLIRNNFKHYYAAEYVAYLKDDTQDIKLRIAMAEALGWFRYSYRRFEIMDQMQALLDSPATDQRLKSELRKTITRLNNKL